MTLVLDSKGKNGLKMKSKTLKDLRPDGPTGANPQWSLTPAPNPTDDAHGAKH